MIDPDAAIKAACRQWLSHHRPVDPAAITAAIAAYPHLAEAADTYGAGGALATLERRTADLLGKFAGLFLIKGVTAQLAVLAAYAEARGTTNVVVPAMSHLELDECQALSLAAGLTPIPLGRHRPYGVADLETITAPVAAVVVELPLRRAGYLLPAWDELRAIADWCRTAGVPLHIDGARAWEAAAGYGVSLTDLAALGDSIYVSFYKGLGGLGGALVAGTEAFIVSLTPWKTRFGGNLVTAWPQAVTALIGLDTQLDRMPGYVARARELAAVLRRVPDLMVHPAAPHTNAFQLWFRGSPGELAERHRHFAERHRVWLFGAFQPAPLDGWSFGEVAIGDASDGWSVDQAADWIATFAKA